MTERRHNYLFKDMELTLKRETFTEESTIGSLSIDQLGNTIGAPLMNNALIKKDCIYLKFGNPDQTISYVLSVNYFNKSLTKLGIIVVKILDFVDTDHIKKAYESGQ